MNLAFTAGKFNAIVPIRHGCYGVFALLIAVSCQAEEPPNLKRPRVIVPDYIAGVETLTAEDVIKLAIEKADLIIVDARISDDRRHGYLENSISLPDVETNCDTLEVLIPSKTSPVMFYCNGIKCGRSVIAVKIARSCGYSNLYWFKGGFEEWKAKGYQYSKNR